MEKKLKDLLDFQRFANNKKLENMLRTAERSADRTPLSDDTLENVYAAGAPEEMLRKGNDKPF